MFPKETKILVVDDMRTMRLVVKNKLKAIGLENVTEADDGSTGWECYVQAMNEGKPFDLVLSDWNMKKMQGVEFLEKVRTHVKHNKTPFILITAESEKEQVVEAMKKGVSNYLTKPFTQDVFNEKLSTVYKAQK